MLKSNFQNMEAGSSLISFLEDAFRFYDIQQKPELRFEDIETVQIIMGDVSKTTVPIALHPDLLSYPDYVLSSFAWHETIHLVNVLKGESVPLYPHNIREDQIIKNVITLNEDLLNSIFKEFSNMFNNANESWYYFAKTLFIIKDVYVYNEILNTPNFSSHIKKTNMEHERSN